MYLHEKGLNIFESEVKVFIGGDTRPSTKNLLNLLSKGIESQGGKAVNFNLVTTPQLQYYGNHPIMLVYLYNYEIKPKNIEIDEVNIENIRDTYWKNYVQHFKIAANYLQWDTIQKRTVDCANGIGGLILP
eukprot:GHVR01160321.1.p1 GENE.GHVR01160321.1~~GHVR01160321.1.p1  ORF type:complete len:131 (-),score=5.74 GHVR01160321.1:972-1364(-)